MREMMFSMMRLSGAVTLFGIEQLQNAVVAPADTQAALVRLRKTLDAMSESLASKMDAPKRAALDSLSRVQIDMLHRTLGVIDIDGAGEFVMKTSESLSSAVGPPSAVKAAGAA